MKITRRIAALGLLAAAVSGCGSKFGRYDGPEVTRVVVFKKQRRMLLLNNKRALKTYRVALGFAPVGDKKIAGDGKTPEGHYYIDRRNPDSRFHLSLGINYPNAHDLAEAKAMGHDPGGDIFIHGRGGLRNLIADWTWGCIAISNKEMEEVYAMVRKGTPVTIYP